MDCHTETFFVLETFSKESFDASKVAHLANNTIKYYAASYVGHSTKTFNTAHGICAATEVRFRFAGLAPEAQQLNTSLYEESAIIKPSQRKASRIEYVVRGNPNSPQTLKGACELFCKGNHVEYPSALFPMTTALYGESSTPNKASVAGPGGKIKMNSLFLPSFQSPLLSRIVAPGTNISSLFDLRLNTSNQQDIAISSVTVELHKLTCTNNESQETIFHPLKPVTRHSFVTMSKRECFEKLTGNEILLPKALYQNRFLLVEPTCYANDSLISYGVKFIVELQSSSQPWKTSLESFTEVHVALLKYSSKEPKTPLLKIPRTERIRSIEVFDRFHFYPGDVTEALLRRVQRRGLLYQTHKCETLSDDASVTIFLTILGCAETVPNKKRKSGALFNGTITGIQNVELWLYRGVK